MPDNTIVTMDDLTDFTTGLKTVLDTSYSGGGTTPEDLETLKTEILEGVEDIVFDYRKNPTAGLQPDFLTVQGNPDGSSSDLTIFTPEFIENVENIDLSKFQKIDFLAIPCFTGSDVTDSRLPSYDLSMLDFSNVKNFMGNHVLFYTRYERQRLYNLNISNLDLRNLNPNHVRLLIYGGFSRSSSYLLFVYNEIIARNIKFPNRFNASYLFAYINTPKLDLRGTNLNDVSKLDGLFAYSRIGQLLYDKDIPINIDLSSCFCEDAIYFRDKNIQYIEDFFDNVAAKTVSDTVTITIPDVDISGTDILSKATAKGYTLTGYSAA